MGAHPFHHRCLELYSCLASACRVCAKTGASGAALRRAALYGLLQSAAAEAMLAVGAGFVHLLLWLPELGRGSLFILRKKIGSCLLTCNLPEVGQCIGLSTHMDVLKPGCLSSGKTVVSCSIQRP